jgi:hypothetical protein
MIKHVVFMKFKDGTTDEAIADLEQSLGELPDRIEEIREYVFGRDVIHSDRSCDFAIVSSFDDLAALDRYQIHPDHQVVVGKVKKISQSVQAVDFEY